ncbi:hypothetical protein [Candidatus Tokpelaia sp.]|nr:hypothetical protein [Candidatus Tokpelaia sp.]
MPEGRIAVLLNKTVKIPAFPEKLQYIVRRDKNFLDKLITAFA